MALKSQERLCLPKCGLVPAGLLPEICPPPPNPHKNEAFFQKVSVNVQIGDLELSVLSGSRGEPRPRELVLMSHRLTALCPVCGGSEVPSGLFCVCVYVSVPCSQKRLPQTLSPRGDSVSQLVFCGIGNALTCGVSGTSKGQGKTFSVLLSTGIQPEGP